MQRRRAAQIEIVGCRGFPVGLRRARSIRPARAAARSTPTTLVATWSCRSKTSSSAPSNRSAQMMRAGRGLDQLAGDAHPVAGLAHAAFEHVAHAELAADLLDVDGLALVGEGRIARDHEQRLEARQRGDDVLDHAVGEIFLLGIAAHVLERQHRDRRLVGQRQRVRALGMLEGRRGLRAEPDAPGAHRLGDVLQRLLAQVVEGDLDLAADLPVRVVRHADAAGLGNAFQPRGDVDAVAEDVVVVDR